MSKRNIITFLTLLIMVAALAILTACSSNESEPQEETPTPTTEATPEPTPDPTPEPEQEPELEPEPQITRPETDREGFPLTLPDEINTIAAIGPSTTEILVGLGFANRIITTDMFSADVVGLPAGVVADFGIMDLDAEFIVNLMPDVIFVTGMARGGGADDPLAPVSAAGITVIYMPTSTSIAAIIEDIRFVAAVMDAYETGEVIITRMLDEISEIAQIATTITETRTVYFEISPAPWTVSFGTGTFLNEMMEIVGATNVFADQEGWISVSDEILLELNPDIILTSTDFIPNPIEEIMERPGFDAITAVQNGNVFSIDTASSNRPTHNITRALREIATAVFPEYFNEN